MGICQAYVLGICDAYHVQILFQASLIAYLLTLC